MRTTVTLDAGVVELLRAAQERTRAPFEQVLNAAIRRGLMGDRDHHEPAFVVKARPLDLLPGIDPARLRDLDDELEVDEFLRMTRALEAARS